MAMGRLRTIDHRETELTTLTLGPAGALPPVPRVGVPDAGSRRFGGDALSEAAFEASLFDLAGLGVEVVPVDLSPFFETADLLYHLMVALHQRGLPLARVMDELRKRRTK